MNEGTWIPFADAEADFFRNPAEKPKLPGVFGVLYLLRRDINQCMAENTRALFPAVMCILAGVDLLAKFHAGSDKRGAVGSRFKQFVREYLSPTSEDEVEVVWLLRNSLMHSFGLYSRVTKPDGTIEAEYKFMFSSGASKTLELVEKRGKDEYLVSAQTLHERFERGVEQYRASLRTDPELQKKFRRMFPFYGTTGTLVADHPPTHREAEDQLLRPQTAVNHDSIDRNG